MWDRLWINVRLASIGPEQGLSIINDGVIAVQNGTIAWAGLRDDMSHIPNKAIEIIDGEGRFLTPGLVDCHTHLVYAGNRAEEFQLRNSGQSYAEIAENGGGIYSTVQATQASSEEDLLFVTKQRLQAMQVSGTTTLEIKSGYGLDLANELKCLRVANRLASQYPITIVTTLLAHIIPHEYKQKPNEYLDLFIDQIMKTAKAEELCDSLDVFCEHIAFDCQQTERLFKAAKSLGLNIKCHADQLSSMGACQLAHEYGAISCDHLEYSDQATIAAMHNAGTVAVLLPGAYYFLHADTKPPIQSLRQHNVPIAIATDCNPGTSPIMSLPTIMNLACQLYQLTFTEAFAGVTLNAAKALKLENRKGSLTVGKDADFVLWNIDDLPELAYYLGRNVCHQVIQQGQPINWEQDYAT